MATHTDEEKPKDVGKIGIERGKAFAIYKGSPISVKYDVDSWAAEGAKEFEKLASKRGLEKITIDYILRELYVIHIGINQSSSNHKKSKYNPYEEEEKLKECYVQKYQSFEAILLNGRPQFLEIVDKQVIIHDDIMLEDMCLKPFDRTMYLNKEYSYDSVDEINEYVKKASNETLDTLYEKVKGIWKKYIDASDEHITLCAADTIFTYFQDRFGLTHYLLYVGDNDTGKSNNLVVFQYLAYRALLDTSVTAANIYQYFGSIEEGQGILLEDEADNIDQDLEKMKIYKVGYQSGKKVSRIDLSSGRKQGSYWTFSFKAFSAERQPNNTKAKGFMERTFVLPCSPGTPDYDILEVINPVGDNKYEKLLSELIDIHKLLLIYRLLNSNKPIPDIELNVKNRDKQLCKSLIRLFQNSSCKDEIMPALSKYLSEKKQRKSDTLDARLYEIMINLIAAQKNLTLPNQVIWQAVKNNIEGHEDPHKPLSYDTEEFYTISQKKITDILESKFGAKKTHTGTERKRGLKFNQDILNKLEPNYAKSEEIRIIEKRDGCDGSDGSGEQASQFSDRSTDANYNNNQENIDRNEINKPIVTENGKDLGVDESGNSDTLVHKPSHPSHPSHPDSDSPETKECEKCGERLLGDPFFRKIHDCGIHE